MSYKFDTSQSQYLDYGLSDMMENLTVLTLHSWVKLDDIIADQVFISMYNATDGGFVLWFDKSGGQGSNILKGFVESDNGINTSPGIINSTKTGRWLSVSFGIDFTSGAVFETSYAWVDLDNLYDDTELDLMDFMGANTSSLDIGRFSGGRYMSGRIAECSVWNRKLNRNENMLLAAGYPASDISRGLIFYDPLDSKDLRNRVGSEIGKEINGATYSSDHPRIISQRTKIITASDSNISGARIRNRFAEGLS